MRLLKSCRQTSSEASGEYTSWTQVLLDHIGARQGGADKVHAIDVSRLKPVLETTVANWKFDQSPPAQAGVGALKNIQRALPGIEATRACDYDPTVGTAEVAR